MFILRAEETSFCGHPRSELGFGVLGLLPITGSAGREDVGDPIRASVLQRDTVVNLKRRDESAISAPATMTLNEAAPLGARETPLRLASTSPICVARSLQQRSRRR